MMQHVHSFRALIDQLLEDRVANYRDSTQPGFRALAVHRFGNWVKTLPKALQLFLFPMYIVMYRWVRNHYGVNIYYTTKIGRRVAFPNQGNVTIHKETVIGDDCVIRQNVSIGGINIAKNDGPVLGRNVEVGAGAVIIGKIKIGDGARIGPNAVIMSSLPEGAIAMAPPPRIIVPPKAGQQSREENVATDHQMETKQAVSTGGGA